MKISRKPAGEVMILKLSGKVMGGEDYDRFHGEIKSLIGEGQVDILLDFGGVSFINSTGLGLLISAYTSLQKNSGRMKICNVNDRVGSVFYVTELHNVFEIVSDEEKALASFD